MLSAPSKLWFCSTDAAGTEHEEFGTAHRTSSADVSAACAPPRGAGRRRIRSARRSAPAPPSSSPARARGRPLLYEAEDHHQPMADRHPRRGGLRHADDGGAGGRAIRVQSRLRGIGTSTVLDDRRIGAGPSRPALNQAKRARLIRWGIRILSASDDGDDGREDVLLEHDQDAQHQSEDDRVPEGSRQHLAFAAFEIGHRHAGGDVLWRDHLAHHAT
jgi:hypothetical protein